MGGRFQPGESLPLLYPSKKYYTQNADQDDLISIGTIGLIKGISSFDPAKGARLATYAARCIENAILTPVRLLLPHALCHPRRRPAVRRRPHEGRPSVSPTPAGPVLSPENRR